MEFIIPITTNVPVSDIKSDGKNPNKMSKNQHDALAENIKRFGFLIPIITNQDLVIADGEQRWENLTGRKASKVE